jgi:cyclopropane fatty-acyl-phospholipid synthase-like methyltransferase
MLRRYSDSCDRNRQPILDQLGVHFSDCKNVLEIGSGTGQHAIFFAQQLSHLHWYTSDMTENHCSISAWIDDSELKNISLPFEFVIGRDEWPEKINVDAVFTANTTHIMQPDEAKQMMSLVAYWLPDDGIFCQYGPMKVDGEFTSESNEQFNQWLLESGFGGIRDIDELIVWAEGMELAEQIPMPANNFLLVWKKCSE